MDSVKEVKNFDDFLKETQFNIFDSFKYKIKGIKWWFLHRLHPKYRYHVHKFRNLKPGWHDVDYRMLHACFDLLSDFVEKEDGLNVLKYQWEYRRNQEEKPTIIWTEKDIEEAKLIYYEAASLYKWWKGTIPSRDSGDRDEVFGRDMNEDTENLIRLMKIRSYLWT